jgi:hypothetical protein
MKTKTIVLLLALVAVLSIGAGIALAQSPALGRLQPLLVDIQQQIPVDVTFVIDSAEPQTVTVPMALDLNIQIGLSSTMTPVVSVAATGPALVSVSQLQATGQPLIDNSDLTYEIEPVEGVEVLQIRSGPDYAENIELVGELRNTSNQTLSSVQIIVTFYDADGAIMDVNTGYLALDDIETGKTGPFTVGLGGAPFADVGRYLIQMKARFTR